MDKIIIEVRGKKEDKHTAVVGLIEQAEYSELRNIVRSLAIPTLLRLARCVHGTMYKEME